MNSASQRSINAANLAQNQAQFNASMDFATGQAKGANLGDYYSNMVSGARSAGLSPLAVMGISNNVSAPMAVGSNMEATNPGTGIAEAGKILAQMKLPGASAASKIDELNAQLLQAKIDNVNSETVGNQIRNSHLSVATQPGVKAGSDPAHAIPAFSWFTDKSGRAFLGQSKEFADTQFGPGSWVPGMIAGAKTAGENAVQAVKSVGDDVSSLWQSVRPDVIRFFHTDAY